ncbi:hypothetical protein [Mongoliibacter ruber]|uniref:Uncharacterized protein n=1 Tax=Mongoliibacter ruber TaxID=1750599 RepID=A0A2T0WV40_9BACT|nr:hypothetical protein [Mongoliibacter ruber]PRY90573.1 hypothetical protein CLW00_101236 [Mongoliibacter ruber]
MFNYITTYFEKIYESAHNFKGLLIISLVNILTFQGLILFVEQYIFSEWHFALAFLIIFFFDTLSGSYIAYRTNTFSGQIFREKLMDKMIAYGSIIISFSVITKVIVDGSEFNAIRYFNLPFYSLFSLVEFRSIVLKWYIFKKWKWLGKLLKWIDKRKKFEIDDEL